MNHLSSNIICYRFRFSINCINYRRQPWRLDPVPSGHPKWHRWSDRTFCLKTKLKITYFSSWDQLFFFFLQTPQRIYISFHFLSHLKKCEIFLFLVTSIASAETDRLAWLDVKKCSPLPTAISTRKPDFSIYYRSGLSSQLLTPRSYRIHKFTEHNTLQKWKAKVKQSTEEKNK